ncbi:MAG: hypothetical protein JWM42_4175 [Burkholderia sp.]|nr:hypothetical protein [Burkholderia sp.]
MRAATARGEHRRQAREARNEAQQRELHAVLQRYRALPIQEKEQRLREQLGITGTWPRHLQVMNTTNDAVDILPRIWQSSVFYRFVYRKPVNDFTFTLDQVVIWVIERFGSRPGSRERRAIVSRVPERLWLSRTELQPLRQRLLQGPIQRTNAAATDQLRGSIILPAARLRTSITSFGSA